MNAPPPPAADTGTAFAQALEALLGALPPAEARLLRLAAVPHWLDGPLLGALLGDQAEVGPALAALRPLRLVAWEPDGRFRLHDAARPPLREALRATDPAAWAAANQAAWAHFRGRAAAGAEGPVAEGVEALYHQLAVDEAGGLAELGRRFDEAAWNHQLGLAECYARVAAEQAPLLSASGRAWLGYYQARAAQLLGAGDGGRAALAALAGEADQRLAALAELSLARAEVAGQRWTAAMGHLNAAQAGLSAAGLSGPETARVAQALGDAYRDLALRSGGFGPAADEMSGPWRRLRLLPFLAARGMARRWRQAPNWWWWHAGLDYQDWIVAWLLERAQGWYRQAIPAFGEAEGRARLDTEAALAETLRLLGRWAAARERFEGLLAEDLVAASPYATARAELGLGTVLADAGALPEARRRLTAAAEVFRRFGDAAGEAAAGLALGRVAERAGEADEAVAAYAACLGPLNMAGDPLTRTEVETRMAALADGGRLSEDARRRVEAVQATELERHYLARFSGSLLLLFRRLALYVATPLTFLGGTLFLAIALLVAMAALETDWRLLSQGLADRISLADHVLLIGVPIALGLAALWLFPFLYGLTGWIAVRFLGGRLVRIEREQPARVVLGPAGLAIHDGGGRSRSLAWERLRGAEALDPRLWRRSLHLLSRTALRADAGEPLLVEGIVARYEALQAELDRRLPAPLALRRQALRILAPGWVAAVLLAGLLAVGRASATGVIGATEAESSGAGEPIRLLLTLPTPTVYLFVTVVLLLTTVTHWRLLGQTLALRRRNGPSLAIVPPPLLALAALAWTGIAGLWLWFLFTPQ